MIRLFVLIGLIGGTAIAYLATYKVGQERQLPPAVSQLEMFEADGLVPGANDLSENPEAGHGIFEVPEEDEVQLAIALKAAGEMPGMDMSGGTMDMGDGTTMNMAEGTTMDMPEGAKMDMAVGATMEMADGTTMPAADHVMGDMAEGTTMNMAEGTTMDMSEGAKMDMAEGATMEMADGTTMPAADHVMGEMAEGTTMNMAEGTTMDMSEWTTMEMADEDHGAAEEDAGHSGGMSAGGLIIADDGSFDREIELVMSEWGYSDMQIDVKMGERIRFTVKNSGKIPHEFMFMTMPAMSAVNYRANRADWSLLEHEALFEQPLILPGGEFSIVVQVMQPGAWMFMCMLPYHMQMGMMGQMASEGMAMSMDM